MDEVEVRPVSANDMDQVLPLIAGYQTFYGAKPDEERNRRFFSRFLHPSEEGLLLGAWVDGGLMGFATFVKEGVRGKGVGRALIQSALDETRRRGAAHLEWFTAPDNATAQRLYDSVPGAGRSTWYAYEIEADT